MDRLHRAADRFHVSKEHLEAAMNGSEFRHQDRIDAASEELRQAEQELEQLEADIKSILAKHA
jgi:predicted nucleotidyltransferase